MLYMLSSIKEPFDIQTLRWFYLVQNIGVIFLKFLPHPLKSKGLGT
jgi:hypothetical protein